MCTVLMGNSSQVLIKKEKKEEEEWEKWISLVTLSPLIYVFIHHKLDKRVPYRMCNLQNMKVARFCVSVNAHSLNVHTPAQR